MVGHGVKGKRSTARQPDDKRSQPQLQNPEDTTHKQKFEGTLKDGESTSGGTGM
jgi:hypothetical protein